MKLLFLFLSLCSACDLGWCEIEENLVITLQCTEECIAEMKDCLVECDGGDQNCELDCHWEQVQCAKGTSFFEVTLFSVILYVWTIIWLN